jgi:hypothetical protein
MYTEAAIASQTLRADLNRGSLHIDVDQGDFPAESLFGFAERRNPKRAFLFVSKVLGKHIPGKPSRMQKSYEMLAAKIPKDLPGPVLVMGMAETAVGLGAGVHRSFSENRPDSVYLVSTRHPVDGELFARFEEEHSHASAHLVYQPSDELSRDMMLSARSLILVDDEASTGKTIINLVNALKGAGLDKVERVVAATLTDWSGDAMKERLGDMVTPVSLLSGKFRFDENPDAPLPEMPSVGTTEKGDWDITAPQDWGRLGVVEHSDNFGLSVSATPGEKVLVVGTGEFVWKPFLLAERLEKQGAEVFFGSTSRSPIAVGHSIETALGFPDNYGLGIPNHLYNVRASDYDRVLICSETPAEAVDPELVRMLKAEVIAQ